METNQTVNLKALPKGITAAFVRGELAFKVKFMLDGARINLGTFHDYQQAVDAMVTFKQNDITKHGLTKPAMQNLVTNHEQQFNDIRGVDPATIYPSDQLATWNEELSQLPTALLTVGQPYNAIPATVVTAYLEQAYNKLLEID